MASRIQFNVRVSPETPVMVDLLCRMTSRHPGDLIDWLVRKAFEELTGNGQPDPLGDAAQPCAEGLPGNGHNPGDE